MHASPKGWREPGSKRGRKRWKRETNGEESARGKKLEGAAGVEDGIDPSRRLSVQLPRGSWDTGVVRVVGARWRHGCAKERSGRGWSWQSRPTHTSPSPSSVSPTSALSSIRRGSRSIYDRIHAALLISLVSRTEISLSLSIGFWSSKHLTASPRWRSQVRSRRVLRVETLTDNGADGGARLKAVAHLTTPQSVSGVNGLFIYPVSTRNNTCPPFLKIWKRKINEECGRKSCLEG